MKIELGIIAAAALLGAPLVAAGQGKPQDAKTYQKSHTQKITATVEAIDVPTRMVTLKTEDGKTETFRVDDRVKNLPQVKVGDIVKVGYYESVAVTVSKAPTGVATSAAAGVVTAKPGEKPGGIATREVTLNATVAAIAPDKKSVTLQGDQGQVVMPVKDPKKLEGVSVGDHVSVVATQALAVSVEKAPAKAAAKPAKAESKAAAKPAESAPTK